MSQNRTCRSEWTIGVCPWGLDVHQINVSEPLTIVRDEADDPGISLALQYAYLIQNKDYILNRCGSEDILDFYFGPLRRLAKSSVYYNGALVDWESWKGPQDKDAVSKAFYLPSTRISSLITGRLLRAHEAVPAAAPFVHTDFADQLARFYGSQQSLLRNIVFPDLLESLLPSDLYHDIFCKVFRGGGIRVDDDLRVCIEPYLYCYFSWPTTLKAWTPLLLALYYILNTESIEIVFIEQPQLGLQGFHCELVDRLVSWLAYTASRQVIISTTYRHGETDVSAQ